MIRIFENIDCMELMKQYPDKYFDLCLTDPPYGVNLKYGIYQDTEENWFELMDKFIPEARRVSKILIMPCCRIRALDWFYQTYPPDWLICWYKGSPGHSAYVGFNDWEPLLVYGKDKSVQYHDYFQCTNTEKMGNHGHPCPKPIKWSKALLTRVLPNKGLVLEPFAGSGTTLIACEEMGFEYVACELDVDYYRMACERIEKFREQGRFDFTPKEALSERPE